MKRRITVQLSEEIVERLEAAVERPGSSKAAIVEAALQRFLGTQTATVDDATLLQRLNRMSDQMDQLDRELRIVSETAALHARYHLSITPPLTQADQRTACALGLERFEAFARQVGRRVHLGTPLMRDTMDRLSAMKRDLLARDVEEGTPFGATCMGADPHQDASAPTLPNGEVKPSAGVEEDASRGGFRGEAHNPYS